MTDVCVFIHAALIVYILYKLYVYDKAMHNIVQLLKIYDKELEELNEFKSRENGKTGVEAEHAGAEDKDGTVQN